MPETFMTWPTIATLLLVTARLAGLFILAPAFAHPALPERLRYFAAVVFALAVTPQLAGPAVAESLPALLAAAAAELVLGLLLAMAAAAVFVGVELGAAHIGHQMGLTLGSIFEADADSDQSLTGFFHLLALVVFLGLGGHRAVLAGLLGTFQAVPLAGFSGDIPFLHAVAALLGEGFLLALRIAAPALAAVLLATAAMGLLQKTMPAVNTLSVGLTVRPLVGMTALAASLAALAPLIERAVSLLQRQMVQLTRAA